MTTAEQPTWMLAELTYRCVLECAYCSNPLNYRSDSFVDELSGQEWSDVLRQARRLGCMQLGISGGEPLLHPDVHRIVRTAAREGFYTSLITGGTRLDESILKQLVDDGLDHVQVSIDGATEETNNTITNSESHQEKLAACRRVRQHDLPLTLNAVLHRFNLSEVGEMIDLAAELDAERIELANAQFHGWALANRSRLMPTKEQLATARSTVERKRTQSGDLEVAWVVPDYHSDYPKPCQGGWGNSFLSVTPGGTVLPCHGASQIDSLDFPNLREKSLRWIWEDSEAFNAFRGTDWMKEPCRSCPRKEIDFGGCRCQAYQLTDDATRTDPACHLSPDHDLVEDALEEARQTEPDPNDLHFRNPQNIKSLQPTRFQNP